MKNSFIIKNIRRALLRQLIFPVLLLFFSFSVFFKTPRDNFFNPRPLNHKSNFENFYNQDLPHVVVPTPVLRYTGYDYVVNGYVRGHYYYTLVGGRCQFYILSQEAGKPPAGELFSMKIRGRLIRMDDIEYESLLKDMAKELCWTPSSLRAVASVYAVSAVPYPIYLNLLFYVVLYGCLLASLLDALCSLARLIQPLGSPALRYLSALGDIRALLPKAEIELRRLTAAKADSIYLTPNYLINIDTMRPLILPLKSVVWIYYHGRVRHLPGMRWTLTYTLHILTIDGKTHDFPKKKKEDLDYILDTLNRLKPHPLLGYTEQNKKSARRYLKAIKSKHMRSGSD